MASQKSINTQPTYVLTEEQLHQLINGMSRVSVSQDNAPSRSVSVSQENAQSRSVSPRAMEISSRSASPSFGDNYFDVHSHSPVSRPRGVSDELDIEKKYREQRNAADAELYKQVEKLTKEVNYTKQIMSDEKKEINQLRALVEEKNNIIAEQKQRISAMKSSGATDIDPFHFENAKRIISNAKLSSSRLRGRINKNSSTIAKAQEDIIEIVARLHKHMADTIVCERVLIRTEAAEECFAEK